MTEEEIKVLIRAWMAEAGISMAEMSRQSGYHRSCLNYWFNGGHKMPVTALVDILEVLGGHLEVTL